MEWEGVGADGVEGFEWALVQLPQRSQRRKEKRRENVCYE